MPIRLQKALADAGVTSRRKAEELIVAGRVRVNGKRVLVLGTRVNPDKDRIEVDGRRVVQKKPIYLVVHKPRGVVTTLKDPEGRQTIGDILRKVKTRVYPVGRLDYHTSGVLLATSDGEFSQALLKPKNAVPKIYIAKIRGTLEEKALQAIRDGVRLDDGYLTRPADVFVEREDQGNSWVKLKITEGKNRQIHRMFEALGFHVGRLVRTSFAEITTDHLRPGEWRPLETKELEKLKKKYVYSYRKASRQSD